jgi:alpha-L-arabinofuranosidase
MGRNGIAKPRVGVTELQLFARFEPGNSFTATPSEPALSPETMPKPDTISEAFYYAGIMNTLLRLDDFGWLLTHSATVNHGGGLRKERERMYACPIYYAQEMYRALIGGQLLDTIVEASTFSTSTAFEHIPAHDRVPVIDCVAARHDDGRIVLLLVHRSVSAPSVTVSINSVGGDLESTAHATELYGTALHARNTRTDPQRIVPQKSTLTVRDGVEISVTLRPLTLLQVIVKKR